MKILNPEAALMPALVALVAAGMLATAHGFQHIGGLAPCALCLEQRGAWWLALGLGASASVLYRRPALKATPAPHILVAAMVLALAWGVYLAGFHTGIEQGWWDGPASCTSTGVRSLADMLQDTAGDIVMCNEIPWALFGISMAGYNFLIALCVLLYAAIQFGRQMRS